MRSGPSPAAEASGFVVGCNGADFVNEKGYAGLGLFGFERPCDLDLIGFVVGGEIFRRDRRENDIAEPRPADGTANEQPAGFFGKRAPAEFPSFFDQSARTAFLPGASEHDLAGVDDRRISQIDCISKSYAVRRRPRAMLSLAAQTARECQTPG